MAYSTRIFVVILTVLLFLAGVADAQWVYLGRKALGKVRHLSNEVKNSQQPGYDVASVLLEARAENVFSTAVTMLQSHKEWKITQRDEKTRSIEFTDGKTTAGMQVSRLEDHLTQIIVVSTGAPGKTGPASLVVNGILRVCREMNINCELADE
jgi:hypothetical protein